MAFLLALQKKMQETRQRIELIRGDITKLTVDAIVNAANSSLIGGGGVDGAIHKAGGPVILKECREIISQQGSCPAGEAVITSAGSLPAKFVIHTVGPVWHGGIHKEPEKLASCYANSLRLAVDKKIMTIAFPNISTGIYGFPKDQAASIAIKTVCDFLGNDTSIKKVYFVCFDNENYVIYQSRMSDE